MSYAKENILEAKRLTELAKIQIAKNKCYKEQVLRLIDNKVYSLEYCENENNLTEFFEKK